MILTGENRIRLSMKYDGTRAETRFRLSAKGTSPFKSAGASVQSTTGSRDVRISVSNAGYTTFRGSLKSTGYPLHSPVSPSLVARMGEMRGAYRILVGKPEGKRPIGRPGLDRRIILI